MLLQLATRILRTTDPRCLWKAGWNCGVKGAVSIHKFKRRLKQGIYFPPFLHVSIINSCNLRCQGCWVDVDAPREAIDLDAMHRLISDAKQHGNSLFGILGGEPFLYAGLLDLLAAHPDCYFQVFTNGQFITEKVAAEMRRLGHITPLISIEGREVTSNERRGKPDVFSRTLRGLENCVKARLFTGVATSLCQSNLDELLSADWLRELIRRGVHYVWYYTYRPVGPKPSYDLALRPDQLIRVRRFLVEMRVQMPVLIVDAYYDHLGRSLCPSAVGLSHHISPRGYIEPCPVIQFAKENIRDATSVFELMTHSAFLQDYRRTALQAMRGCIVLERPDLLRELVLTHGALDSTARATALAELSTMTPHFSQWLPGEEIPEQHWLYRWAKRFGFNDFGAYRQANHPTDAKCRALKTALDQVVPAKHNWARREPVLK